MRAKPESRKSVLLIGGSPSFLAQMKLTTDFQKIIVR
jgi:hypothetical protein